MRQEGNLISVKLFRTYFHLSKELMISNQVKLCTLTYGFVLKISND